MGCSVLMSFPSTWFKATSILFFLLLTSTSRDLIWALDRNKCAIEQATIKDRNGQFQSIFRGETGTSITIKIKGFDKQFTFFRPGKEESEEWGTDRVVKTNETKMEIFERVICQHQNVSSTENLQKFTSRTGIQQLWDDSCSGEAANNETEYLLCPLTDLNGTKACVIWASREMRQGPSTFDFLNSTLKERPLCVDWGKTCNFENLAYKSAEKHCLRDGKTSKSECEKAASGEQTDPQQILATINSPALDCSDFKIYTDLESKKVPWNKPEFTIPSCGTGTKKLSRGFDGSCTLSYNYGKATVTLDLSGSCDKGWRFEISDQMRNKAGHVRCRFNKKHTPQNEWATVNFTIEFLPKLSTATSRVGTAETITPLTPTTFTDTGQKPHTGPSKTAAGSSKFSADSQSKPEEEDTALRDTLIAVGAVLIAAVFFILGAWAGVLGYHLRIKKKKKKKEEEKTEQTDRDEEEGKKADGKKEAEKKELKTASKKSGKEKSKGGDTEKKKEGDSFGG